MTHPRFHPALSILLILAVLLAACQPLTTTTPGVATPRVTPRPLATLIPTATPPAPTQTPSFPADVQRLQGLKLVVWHPYVRRVVERTVTIGSKGTVEAQIAVPAPIGRRYANEVMEHPYTRCSVLEETKREIDPMLHNQEH